MRQDSMWRQSGQFWMHSCDFYKLNICWNQSCVHPPIWKLVASAAVFRLPFLVACVSVAVFWLLGIWFLNLPWAPWSYFWSQADAPQCKALKILHQDLHPSNEQQPSSTPHNVTLIWDILGHHRYLNLLTHWIHSRSLCTLHLFVSSSHMIVSCIPHILCFGLSLWPCKDSSEKLRAEEQMTNAKIKTPFDPWAWGPPGLVRKLRTCLESSNLLWTVRVSAYFEHCEMWFPQQLFNISLSSTISGQIVSGV